MNFVVLLLKTWTVLYMYISTYSRGDDMVAYCSQFKIFKKKLHLPSPFTKTGELFWPDFPKFHFFVDQGVRTGRTGLNNSWLLENGFFLVGREIQIRK